MSTVTAEQTTVDTNKLKDLTNFVKQAQNRGNQGRAQQVEKSEAGEIIEKIHNNTRQVVEDAMKLRDMVRQKVKSEQQVADNSLEQTLNLVMNLAQVEDIWFVSGRVPIMGVETKGLYCVDPRTEVKHYIGKFILTFELVYGVQVRMFNTHFNVQAFNNSPCHSPHSLFDARPCLGNIALQLREMGEAGDVYGMVLTCIMFLEAVNTPDPAGSCIEFWPYVSEDGEACAHFPERIKEPMHVPANFVPPGKTIKYRDGMSVKDFNDWVKNLKKTPRNLSHPTYGINGR